MKTIYKNLKNRIHWFFNPAQASKEVYEDLRLQRKKVKELVEEYRILRTWNERYSDLLGTITDSVSALIWRKDRSRRYMIGNPIHCRVFFGLEGSPSCLDLIEGKTDEELIKILYEKNGIQNTFGEICTRSDKYIEKYGKTQHFIEGAVVDGEEILLYVIKIPLYDQLKVFDGTVGIAWDVTKNSKFVISQLNRWIYDKRAKELYNNKESKVFIYTFNPLVDTCSIFQYICSDPKRDTTCNNGSCEKCSEERRTYCARFKN